MTATAVLILLAWLFALCAGVRFVAPFCGFNDSEPRGEPRPGPVTPFHDTGDTRA